MCHHNYQENNTHSHVDSMAEMEGTFIMRKHNKCGKLLESIDAKLLKSIDAKLLLLKRNIAWEEAYYCVP